MRKQKTLSHRLSLVAIALCVMLAAFALSVGKVNAADSQNMYRLYNPNSGEHFYTAATDERSHLISLGWRYEGIGWVAPTTGEPVYRLYNPNAGDHHYTRSIDEKNSLINVGWKDEGVGWYSGGTVPLYRQYNPNATSGAHNYTTSKDENDSLVRAGWKAEDIGWYGVGNGSAATNTNIGNNTSSQTTTYIINLESGKLHLSTCWQGQRIGSNHKATFTGTREALLAKYPASQGYTPCEICNP